MMTPPACVMLCGLVVVLLTTGLTEARHSSCRQPSNQELAQYLSGGSSLPESFYQFPQLLKTVQTYSTSSEGYRARISTFYDEGKNCSYGKNQDPCPVTWVFNYDSDRFPDTLVEAKCKQCERGGFGFTCRPVYYYTKVMRKGSCNTETGVYNYQPMYEQVSISCALQALGAVESATPSRLYSENEFSNKKSSRQK